MQCTCTCSYLSLPLAFTYTSQKAVVVYRVTVPLCLSRWPCVVACSAAHCDYWTSTLTPPWSVSPSTLPTTTLRLPGTCTCTYVLLSNPNRYWYIHAFAYIHVSQLVHLLALQCTCTYTCIYTCTCRYKITYMYSCVYVRVHIHVHVYK